MLISLPYCWPCCCCCCCLLQQNDPGALAGCVIYSSSLLGLSRAGAENSDAARAIHVDETIRLTRVIQKAIFGAVFAAVAESHVDPSSCSFSSASSSSKIGIKSTRSKVAVKVLSFSVFQKSSPSLQEDFLSELNFFECLRGHPNIVTPVRVYVDLEEQLLLLLFPLAEFEDLFEVLRKRTEPFTEPEVRLGAALVISLLGL